MRGRLTARVAIDQIYDNCRAGSSTRARTIIKMMKNDRCLILPEGLIIKDSG